ncbi:MAG TPA: efflux RND transporter periplasmic adaptor subunit [Nitrospiria bacterium]
MIRRTKFWLVLIVIGLAAAVLWRVGDSRQAPPSYRTVKVERGDIEETIQATGAVQPQNRLEIRPPIAGRAEDVLVREGEAVRKGKILAWMSSTERAALLDAARARGPEELAHWGELFKATPLIAPMDGVIIARAVEPGQTVTVQDAVLVMSDRLIIKAQVDETDMARVRVGQAARVTLDAYPDGLIPGRVDRIRYEAKTVNNVTIYEVEILPEATPEFMRSGMTANIVFTVTTRENVLLLPFEAVHPGNGRADVWLPGAGDEKQPVTREVQIGLTDGKRLEIVSGLNEGDSVLVTVVRIPPSSPGAQNPFSPFGRSRSGSR